MVDVRLCSKDASVIGAFLIPLHLNDMKIHRFVDERERREKRERESNSRYSYGQYFALRKKFALLGGLNLGLL